MCVTWCHRQKILYWNHDDCHPADCSLVNEPLGQCEDCRHRWEREDRVLCDLTRAALPEQGGCCHWNVEPVTGRQEISWDMLSPLRIGVDEMVEQVLKCYEVPYVHGPRSEALVNPDDLGLPQTFGLGTEHLVEEDFDWTDCGQ